MSETERAVFKVRIDGSIDDVWRELTRSDRPQWAMFNSRLDTDGVAPGGQLRMRTPNGRYTAVAGRYIEVDAGRRLSHSFRFTNYDDPECKVTYDLREQSGAVELTLTVENIPVGTKSAKQLKQGGPFIVNNLKAIVETGRPTPGARILFVLFKLLEPFSPARSRSENWPLNGSEPSAAHAAATTD